MCRRALLAGVEQASMEETAECSEAVGVLEAMGIDSPRCPTGLEVARLNGLLGRGWCGDEAVRLRNREDEADVRGAARSGKRKRPLVGRVAAKPAVELRVQKAWCSYLASPLGWCANGRSAFQDLDDEHRRTAVPADEDRTDSKPGIVGRGLGLRHDV